jgi:hypothetical protein
MKRAAEALARAAHPDHPPGDAKSAAAAPARPQDR